MLVILYQLQETVAENLTNIKMQNTRHRNSINCSDTKLFRTDKGRRRVTDLPIILSTHYSEGEKLNKILVLPFENTGRLKLIGSS